MPVQMHKWIRWKSKQKKGQTIISLVDRNEVHRFWNGFQVERAVQRRKCTKVHLFGNYKSLKLRSTYRLLTRINWIIWIRGIVNFTNRLYLHRLLTFQRQTEKKGKKKTQPNKNHLKQRKYCKTDSIAHVVWPDAVWWHVSNVAAHTHIIPFAICFTCFLIARFRLIIFHLSISSIKRLIQAFQHTKQHLASCKEMAIVDVPTRRAWITRQLAWNRHFNLKKLSIGTRAIPLLNQYYVILVFFCYFWAS